MKARASEENRSPEATSSGSMALDSSVYKLFREKKKRRARRKKTLSSRSVSSIADELTPQQVSIILISKAASQHRHSHLCQSNWKSA
ncbi:hypothetical protein EUGRSUZ_E02294 [Eucalyptus grandis]|uniref:Uncharacterized protein n=2 Tax=Eucalyptus grandis TaxID=71139 RepID=A0A059C5D6_EUCGR|nr:hypothetical protein EUGRSUZ_E02294 [Eucalyptus grandis]